MNRRGHGMLVVMTAMTVGLLGGAVFATRLSINLQGRKGAALRDQTLWLARSGCLAGVKGRLGVKTPQGTALVQRQGDSVSAELHGARAVISCATLEQRYTAPH